MKITAKPNAFVAVVTACAFLFQFSACSFSTKPQKVPVTSNPVGAKINVDGQDAGTTPLTLSLKREKDHRIRIEKPGYNPVDILLVSKPSSANPAAAFMISLFVIIPVCIIAGGLLGYAVAGTENIDHKEEGPIIAGALAGAAGGAVLAVGITHKANQRRMDPSVLNVSLEKTQAQARTKVVLLDRDEFQGVRWIRISCAEGGADDVVAVN